jgi:hypothetical protein
MRERVKAFVNLDDLPTLKPDPAHHKEVDPAVIEQISKAHNFPSREAAHRKALAMPDEESVIGGAAEQEREPEPNPSLQTLFDKPEQTKLSSFNLPLSFRSLLKDIAEATGADMTRVLVMAARPQLEQWRGEVKRRKKR